MITRVDILFIIFKHKNNFNNKNIFITRKRLEMKKVFLIISFYFLMQVVQNQPPGDVFDRRVPNNLFSFGRESSTKGNYAPSSRAGLKNPFERFNNRYMTEMDTTEDTTPIPIPRKNIKIAIILPQDALNMRNLRGCITREMNKINNGNWNFLKHFFLDR